ncbi:hypothetical protein [Allisonella histaminiformans]|uniref:hypothetical protein n=1 Tax=Allisonella histaminiformans TaxID=209880 RepID=UPI002E77D36D|nr:hypothetical protein [Allisonella histaminiformans]
MGKIKNFVKNHGLDVLSVVILAVVVFCCGYDYYLRSRTSNDYRDVNRTVDNVETRIDRAGKRLESAQAEIKNAELHVKRADETAGKLAERTKRNAEELDECQHIADRMSERSERIQGIIADVEKANQGNGAQADGTP